VTDLVTTGLAGPTGIGVTDNFIYWTDNGTDKIQRSDLDGSNVTDLVTTGLVNPRFLAVIVPEPSRALLSLLGLGVVGILFRKRKLNPLQPRAGGYGEGGGWKREFLSVHFSKVSITAS
jgi:hypothetical protein